MTRRAGARSQLLGARASSHNIIAHLIIDYQFTISRPTGLTSTDAMASVVISTVTATITAKATTSTTPASRAASQDGIIGGANPSKFDPKNPIIVFIIQVEYSLLNPGPCSHVLTRLVDWHHHHLHPPSPLPSVQDAPASCHRRDHRRYPTWSLGVWVSRIDPPCFQC